MKQIQIKIPLFFFALLSGVFLANAQNKDLASVKKMVDSKNFIFKAQLVSSQGGRTRNLTSEYDLVVRPDSVIAFLPYFGRAYTAPINLSDGGIKFTSADFSYKPARQKKDRWEIEINPRDVQEGYRLYLSIFSNGRASLRVNSNNRQPINFDGYITEGRPFQRKAF
jgi:hypothetical protein